VQNSVAIGRQIDHLCWIEEIATPGLCPVLAQPFTIRLRATKADDGMAALVQASNDPASQDAGRTAGSASQPFDVGQ